MLYKSLHRSPLSSAAVALKHPSVHDSGPRDLSLFYFFSYSKVMPYSQLHRSISRVGAKRKSHLSERWWWCVRACVCESFRSSHVGMAGGGIESGRKYHETGLKRCLLFSSAADKESVPSSQTEPPGFFLFLFVQFFCLSLRHWFNPPPPPPLNSKASALCMRNK